MKWIANLGFLLVVTLFSLMVSPGYEVFSGDHEIFLPQIYHKLDPSLFKNDLLLKFDEIKYTLFDELIINFSRILNLDLLTSFFLLTFITRTIYYLSIFKLSLIFFRDKIFSYLCTILFISGFSVFGYPYSTMETLLVPRFMSLSLSLLSLSLLFENKNLTSLLVLVVGGLIHPFTILPFVLFIGGKIFIDLTRR